MIIEVPSALGLHPDGVEDAPDALRAAGLHDLVHATDVVRINVPTYNSTRDSRTHILNADGIALLARRLAYRVAETLTESRFPLVVGGDCSLLLGPLLALRHRGRYGLAFIDCHADFWHPYNEPTGEAASLDLALATGRGPSILTDLEGCGPLVRDADVVLIGYRAFGDNDHYLGEHVRDTAITIIDLPHIREFGVSRSLDAARAQLTKPELEGFWGHFDVDVLDDNLMPAVDHHHPGGLSWREAERILQTIIALPGCVGLDITIFNPRLDHDGALAQRLAELVGHSVESRRTASQQSRQ